MNSISAQDKLTMDACTIDNLEIADHICSNEKPDRPMERYRKTGHLPTTRQPFEKIPRAKIPWNERQMIKEQLQLAIQNNESGQKH